MTNQDSEALLDQSESALFLDDDSTTASTSSSSTSPKWTVLKVIGLVFVVLALVGLSVFTNLEELYTEFESDSQYGDELIEYVNELDFEDMKTAFPSLSSLNMEDIIGKEGEEDGQVDDEDNNNNNDEAPSTAAPPRPAKPTHFVGKSSVLHQIVDEKCNLFDGEWTYRNDLGKPAYKRLAVCRIEGRWNCHNLYGVPVEKRMSHEEWLWQPKKCDIPNLEAIGAALKPDMRILIVGDSLLYNQFLSLQCLLGTHSKSFPQWQVDFFRDNFILKCKQGQDFIGGEKLQRDIFLYELSPLINNTETLNYDVVLMGTGHHYSIPPTVNYHPADAVKPSEAVPFAIKTVEKTLRSIGYKGLAVWQGYTPRHFQTAKGGMANKFKGGQCKEGNTLDFAMHDELVDKLERATEMALNDTDGFIKLLNITKLTTPRRDAHPGDGNGHGGMDCTHFCLPGLPDDWNMLFLASLPRWLAENAARRRAEERA